MPRRQDKAGHDTPRKSSSRNSARTPRENGGRGTDHGTGGLALLLEGSLNGGRVVSRWPGLASSVLFEGRDLVPTTDLRALFKGVLREHLGATDAALEEKIFPNSRSEVAVAGLTRRA